MHKYIFLVFNPAPPTSTHPHFVFTSLHLHRVKNIHRKRVMRFDATRLERCYCNHRICKRAAFSFVFIMRTLSYRRARRVQCAARAAFACIASRAYQPNISCQYLPVCSLQMRHVRNISVLWQAQIRRSSWYSYSLSLCAEPLLFLKKKKKKLRGRERPRKTTAASTTVLSMEAGFRLLLLLLI